MTKPNFEFDKIKFSVDPRTFKRAIEIYETGKIKNFKDEGFFYSAKVQGTYLYDVSVTVDEFDRGRCNCYIGEQDELCKHMVALAIYAIFRGKKIPDKQKNILLHPKCSNKLGNLKEDQLIEVKRKISEATRLIRAYSGNSRTWFKYQNKLSEGVSRLTEIVSNLPVSKQTADILVRLIIRLDKKLVRGGVDDSDGTVGGFIADVVDILIKYSELDPETIFSFKKLQGLSTCFDWEKPLLKILEDTDRYPVNN